MNPNRIILFRFDRHPRVCRSRVALLRQLNPGVPVFGLFGGERGYRHAVFRLGGKSFLGLDGFYWSRRSGPWNWKNGDLVTAAWYRDVGHRVAFDIAHVIEWDLLLLDSLERVYQSVPDGAVGLTSLTPISLIQKDWPWTREPEKRRQWEQLLAYARDIWGYDHVPHACLGGGPCLPMSFLAKYAAINAPDYGNDELRLPLFAQILGFPIADTGLRHQGVDRDEDPFFSTTRQRVGREIELSTIMAELAKAEGRRAFHPFVGVFRGAGEA